MASTAELDAFTGTSGQDLTARTGWNSAALFGTSCEIKTSNDCSGITGGDSNANTWDTILGGADGETWIIASGKGSSDDSFLLFGRLTTKVGATVDGYCLEVYTSAGADVWNIHEILNGSLSLLTTTTDEWTANDELLFSYSGTALVGKKNGTTIISTTDATYGSAGYIGLFVWGTAMRATSFGGGVVSAGRTAKNTRGFPLGTEIGMGWRMAL